MSVNDRITQIPLLPVALALASTCGCAVLGTPHGPSEAQRAKVSQLVGPFEQRDVPLSIALQALAGAAARPVGIEACETLLEQTVTMVTTQPEELGILVKGLALQVGAPVRLFVGHHGEFANPTLFCRDDSHRLITIEASSGRNEP